MSRRRLFQLAKKNTVSEMVHDSRNSHWNNNRKFGRPTKLCRQKLLTAPPGGEKRSVVEVNLMFITIRHSEFKTDLLSL